MSEEKSVSSNPNDFSYWRQDIVDAIKNGKEDELLCVEDFLEGCCVKAYKQGVKDGIEAKPEYERLMKNAIS